MQRIVKTQTGVGSSSWIGLNYNNDTVGISLQCIVSGTATYTVEHTLSDFSGTVPTSDIFPHGVSNLVGATTSQEGNFVLPISAVRVTITSGTGSVTITVLQQGI